MKFFASTFTECARQATMLDIMGQNVYGLHVSGTLDADLNVVKASIIAISTGCDEYIFEISSIKTIPSPLRRFFYNKEIAKLGFDTQYLSFLKNSDVEVNNFINVASLYSIQHAKSTDVARITSEISAKHPEYNIDADTSEARIPLYVYRSIVNSRGMPFIFDKDVLTPANILRECIKIKELFGDINTISINELRIAQKISNDRIQASQMRKHRNYPNRLSRVVVFLYGSDIISFSQNSGVTITDMEFLEHIIAKYRTDDQKPKTKKNKKKRVYRANKKTRIGIDDDWKLVRSRRQGAKYNQ